MQTSVSGRAVGLPYLTSRQTRAINYRGSRSSRLQCTAAAAAAAGTPVAKNSILVVGGTGTLGRQVVRKALDEGYDVRCIVRPRQNPADFLRDWGATTVQADLTDLSSLPATLVGVSAIIDCATARPEESTRTVDWEGKVALIQCAQAMGISRYIFFSIYNAEKHPEVPLMAIKSATEDFLRSTGMPATILRLCGFHQAVIGNYAVPILEDRQVWGTNDDSKTAYMDTQDIARMTLAALRSEAAVGKTLTLAGPTAYSTKQVIEMCEDYSGERAQVTTVPTWLLKTTRNVLKSMDWSRDAADRLAFAEVLSNNETWTAPMDDTYALLGIEPESITTLPDYLKEYHTKIMKKLKEVGASADRTNFYV